MENQIEKLKKELPRGAVHELAKRLKLSTSTISQVLNGKLGSAKKPEIIKAAAEILAEYKEREKAAENAIKAALSN